MESWNWTICCLTSCSNGGKHAHGGGGRRSHAALSYCWKINVLLLIHVKALRRKNHWSTINLTTMTKTTRAQFPKQATRAMVDVNMSLTPPKVIGREACLQAKNRSRLSKDPRCKKCPNILWREESKEIRDSMKVKDGGVCRKKYNGHYMK